MLPSLSYTALSQKNYIYPFTKKVKHNYNAGGRVIESEPNLSKVLNSVLCSGVKIYLQTCTSLAGSRRKNTAKDCFPQRLIEFLLYGLYIIHSSASCCIICISIVIPYSRFSLSLLKGPARLATDMSKCQKAASGFSLELMEY